MKIRLSFNESFPSFSMAESSPHDLQMLLPTNKCFAANNIQLMHN